LQGGKEGASFLGKKEGKKPTPNLEEAGYLKAYLRREGMTRKFSTKSEK